MAVGLVVVAGVLVYAVVVSSARDQGTVLVAVVGVLVPVVTWAADRRSKTTANSAPAEDQPAEVPVAEAPPKFDVPRLVVDPAGRIGGGDHEAARGYVARLKSLPASQRSVHTDGSALADQSDLNRARIEFERVATEFAKGSAVYPWGPPSTEDWAIALETLWSLTRKDAGAGTTPWYAWPPGGAGNPVRFEVPRDDDLIKRASEHFDDRPLHIQKLDSRIVWRWVAPAAVHSACLGEVAGMPVVLDEWRVFTSDPRGLTSVEPAGPSVRIASSATRAWSW